jgi:hypothetical protein
MQYQSLLSRVRYPDSEKVRQALLGLDHYFKALQPKLGTLISNTGDASELIVLEGESLDVFACDSVTSRCWTNFFPFAAF